MEGRTGKQRIPGGRRRRQCLASDADGQRVICRLIAARGIAHQIDTDTVIAIRWQNARELVAGRAADEHRDIAAARGEDVEIAGSVAGLHLDAQGLPGAGAHLIVDVVITLDLALDHRRGRALGELDGLATSIRVGGGFSTRERLNQEQCDGDCWESSVHCCIFMHQVSYLGCNNGGRNRLDSIRQTLGALVTELPIFRYAINSAGCLGTACPSVIFIQNGIATPSSSSL